MAALRRRRATTRRVLARCSIGFFLLLATFASAAVAQSVPEAAPAPQVDREIQVAADAFVKDARIPDWVQPYAIPESRGTGPAVVQVAEHQVMIGSPNVIYVRNAIRINDAAALTPLGRVPIAFIPAYQKVVLHTLQVIRDGQVHDRLQGAQIRFLQRETGLENNIYSGIVTASILLDDLRVGDTIELAWSVSGTNPVFGERYSYAENWDQQLPIDYRRMIVNMPIGRTIRWKFHGDLAKNFPQPVERIHDGLRSLTFEERDLPRVTPEPLTPAGFNPFRWVQLSEYADWQGVATWASTLFDGSEPPNAERAALVAQLMAKATVEERVVGALEFVQSKIRYFSVSLGTSSHRPTAPNIVIARRYGDCKDKSLLLVTLLKDMGIASTPVLARLGNRTGFDDWLPTPLAFDHVIVAVDVDGTRYWLDSTRQGQHGRLATMGQAHDGAEVLPATADGALTRIDAPDRYALNLNEISESLTVPKLDGDATLEVVQTLHGVAAENFRAGFGLLTKERIEEGVTNDMQKRYAEAKLVEPPRFDDDPVDNRVTLTTRFALKKPIEHTDGVYRISFRAANFGRIFTLPSESVRHAPVALRYPLDVEYHFDAVFPDDVAVVENQRTLPVESHFFTSNTSRTFVANHFEVAMSLRTLADRVAPTDLPTLKEDLKKLDRSFPTLVAIRDADIKKPVFLGFGTKDFSTTLKERQEDTVAKVSATIASGRLTGKDLARAFCTRALARDSLGHTDEALQDADRSVEEDPNGTTSLVCRAEVRLVAGRFAPAEEDASQAIVLGAETGGPWQVRGEARFHLGHFADAADDFAKAATIDTEGRQNANHDLWRAMAVRRSGKPLPDDLQKRAAEAEHGAWPGPALALFADRIKPDALTAFAASRPGDEATMVGTEADFYLGEFYLATGDTAKAREAFTAALARGVIVYTEYGASAIELGRMGAAPTH